MEDRNGRMGAEGGGRGGRSVVRTFDEVHKGRNRPKIIKNNGQSLMFF